MVEKEKTERIARNILKYKNAFRVCVQMDFISNVGVTAYINRSGQLLVWQRKFKDMPFVGNIALLRLSK